MTLPTSGALNFSNLQSEFGGSNPIIFSEYYAGSGLVPSGTTGSAGIGPVPSSGAINLKFFYGTSASLSAQTFLQIITNVGVNNSILCLDAADINSYANTAPDDVFWNDQSANNHAWSRVDSTRFEPPFFGVAGSMNANTYFFSSYQFNPITDNPQHFDASTTMPWTNWDKKGSTLTIITVWYTPNTDTTNSVCMFGTTTANPLDGLDGEAGPSAFSFGVNATGKGNVFFRAQNSHFDGIDTTFNYSTIQANLSPSYGIANNAWHFYAVTLNEAAGTGRIWVDNANVAFTSTYRSGANQADTAPGSGTIGQFQTKNTRVHIIGAWQKELTAAQVDSIYSQIKQRRPTLGLP